MKQKTPNKESWFNFYAGYSGAFVRDVLVQVMPNNQGRVLDPWNGSGTTTTTAHEQGIDSTGIDINPVMIIVAKAKLLSPGVVESLLPLAEEIIALAKQTKKRIHYTDPLLEWFTPAGALPTRLLADAISKILMPSEAWEKVFLSDHICLVSDLAAFFLVALFRTTRSLVVRFRPTNPTWIKAPESDKCRIRPNPEKVYDEFRLNIREMLAGVAPISGQANTIISLGSSSDLPLAKKSVDAVIASPPYCTRIDYAIATKPELAVLGYSQKRDFDSLRRLMMGGPVVTSLASSTKSGWGENCVNFLKAVETHPSKGSRSYYHKLFLQYYAAMYESLQEINRVLVPDGQCVLVVQDSFYKEVHIDVAKHIGEMARNLGWTLKNRFDFEANLVMARMNPKIKKYRTYSGATESVLWFRKAS